MIRTIIAVAAASFAVVGSAAAAGLLSESNLARPNHDAFFSSAQGVATAAQRLRAEQIARSAPKLGALASEVDAVLGTATFLWAGDNSAPAALGALAPRALAEARARDFAGRQIANLGIGRESIDSAVVREVHDSGSGAVIVRFSQNVGGVEVFNRDLNVMMSRDGRHIATSGYFAPQSQANGTRFGLGGAQAISAAFADLGGSLQPSRLSLSRRDGAYEWYSRPSGDADVAMTRDPRAKKVYFPMADRLVAGWYVEVNAARANGESAAYGYVISAENGAVLFRKDQVAEAYSYRVFADSTGIHQPFDAPIGNGYAPFPGAGPSVVAPRVSATANLVTLNNGPISTNDPWLPANASTTTGNNVDAYLDTGLLFGIAATAPLTDGYQARSGDLRTSLTGTNTFDYPIVADADPASLPAKNAAIVNLFYMNNWLHDFWYDHGFNEVAGNAQTNNLGRGGSQGDPILAEGQDASGRNNANMSTPADGGSPRMQMYLFDGPVTGQVAAQTPTPGPSLVFSTASFGPRTFDVTAEVAVADENAGVSRTDGCSRFAALPGTGTTLPAPPDFRLRGKIAFIDRGTCAFTTKEQFAQRSGAVAMVVVQNVDSDPIPMGNADVPTLPINLPLPTSTDGLYHLPAVMIRRDAAQVIRDQIAAGTTVTMRVNRAASIDYDGTLDNQIIAHEFFHYVSNRLVGNGSGLGNQQGGGMGEGWSDFDSLLLTIRPEDRQVPGNAGYNGAYPLAYYVTPSFNAAYQYYGIRRQPYSRDFTKNSLTFRHIQDGTPLATTAPTAFGQDGATNSEVHNTGEVWSEMLFECYTNLLDSGRYNFVTARSRMQDYIIGGLKLTPNSPTILEARDGVLAAAMAGSPQDYADCFRGFAKRGAGVGAVGPARNSTTNVGVTESYVTP